MKNLIPPKQNTLYARGVVEHAVKLSNPIFGIDTRDEHIGFVTGRTWIKTVVLHDL